MGRQRWSRTATGGQPLRTIQIRMHDDYQIEGAAFSLKDPGRAAHGEGSIIESPGTAALGAVVAPLALRHPVEHVIHGDRRVDHYAWMREKSDPRVREYLQAENAYTKEMMQPSEALQET